MAVPLKNLGETFILPSSTRERFIGKSGLPESLREIGVELGGRSEVRSGYRMLRLRPAFHALLYCVKGRFRWVSGDREGTCGPGDRLLLPAGRRQGYEPIGSGWNMIWWHLNALRSHARLADEVRLSRDPDSCTRMERVMEGTLGEMELRRESAPLALWTGLLAHHLRRDLEGGVLGSSDGSRLDEVWRVAAGRLEEKWTLAKLASATVWSPPHFARLCLSRYGEPPMRRLARLRMERAEVLLVSTGLSVAEIARRLSYEDVFAFSAAFRRHAGKPPAVWRGRRRE